MSERLRTYPALDVRWPPLAHGNAAFEERLAAALYDLDIAAVEELTDSWRVFFRSPQARDRAADVLAASLGDGTLTVRALDVPDEDWAERCQASLGRVTVGPFVIAPPWDVPPLEEVGKGVLLLIEPSMGFGTGHHATTRLCLRALASLDLADRSFLDIGTGSGILAIAAYLRGARPVVAIDTDPDAVESARLNVALNSATDSIRIVTGDYRLEPSIRATTVAANLTGGMLIRGCDEIMRMVEADGLLVTSGFAQGEALRVHAALARYGPIVSAEEEDGWCAATVRVAAVGGC